MSEVHLVVNGRAYEGWLGVRIVRSIEAAAGSFDLDLTDRWGGQEIPWAIGEEDPCQVRIDGETVIDGFVDRRSLSIAAEERALSYSGRDRAAALVDSSALLDVWTFRNADALAVARAIAEPFGIKVSLQAGLVLPKAPRKFVVSPGDGAFEAILRAAQPAGVLVVSDGAGGILLTRAGVARARIPLVLGENILSASVDYNAADRFHRYVVLTQTGGTDGAHGEVTRIRGEATDDGIRRTDRVMVIRPENGITADYARRRADWEARNRAALAETVSVNVRGWQQEPGGDLWPLNALVDVRADAIGVNGDLLIAELEHTIGADGEVTRLKLMRPDAFTPEPAAVVKKSSGAAWKGIAGGV